MNTIRGYKPRIPKGLATAIALCAMVVVQGSLATETPARKKQAIYLIHGLSGEPSINTRWPANFVALLDAKIEELGDDYRVFALDYRQAKLSAKPQYQRIDNHLILRERASRNWNTIVRQADRDNIQASTNVTRLSNLIKQSMQQDLDSSYKVNLIALSFGGFIARDYVVEHMHGVSELENMTGSITFVDHPHHGTSDYIKKFYILDDVWGLADVDVSLSSARAIACNTHALCGIGAFSSSCGENSALQCAATKRLELWDSWVNTNDNDEGRYRHIEWTNFYGAGPMENPPERFVGGVARYNLPPGRTDTPGEEEFRSCSTSGGNSHAYALDGGCGSEVSDFSPAHRVKAFDHNYEMPFIPVEDEHGAVSTLRKKRALRQLGLMHLYRFGDVTGDGAKDIVEFDDVGVRVHEALPVGEYDETAEVPGFKPPVYWTDQFSYQGGWRFEQHPRYLVDINGDGVKDIAGFGDSGLFVAYSNSSAASYNPTFSDAEGPICSEANGNGNCWSASNGYKGDQHPRIVTSLGENSDRDFLVYFSNGNLAVGELLYDATTGVRFEHRASSNTMGFDGGWRAEKNPRMLADVSGDGWLDVVGFGQEAVRVATSNAAESSLQLLASNWYESSFTPGDGNWEVVKHPRVTGDVNGDGADDIVGFAGAGVVVALSNGTGFSQASTWTNGLSFSDQWRVDDTRYDDRRRTDRFVKDANGDGLDDVIAYFKENDLRLYLSNGHNAFAKEEDLSSFPQLLDAMEGTNAPLNHERFLVDVHDDGFVRLVTVGANEPYNDKAQQNFELIDRDGDGHADTAEVVAGSDPRDPNSIPLPPGCS